MLVALCVSMPLATAQTGGSGFKQMPDDAGDMVPQPSLRASACAPASALRDLEWNNVRALIENGGTLWHERANFRGSYIVPKEDNVSTVFAGALWIGGISPDQQLKLAAVMHRRNGKNDFWPGPLTNDGSAEVDVTVCDQYDRFYISNRADAQRHRQYFDAVAAGTVEEDFPEGYAMPAYFREYPAHGNTAANQDYYLAPFKDYDGDGNYIPENGDYPWFDFLQEIDCANRKREDIVPLYGDRNFYWVFNDKGNIHTESQGEPIGMEVWAQAFAFDQRRGQQHDLQQLRPHQPRHPNAHQHYMCQWVDSDLGGISDDYVGATCSAVWATPTTSIRRIRFVLARLRENPPAFGVDFFEGPYQDADSIDNPLTANFSNAVDSLGIPYEGIGIGYGDGVVDNERFGMRRFIYFNWGSGPNTLPTTAGHFYNYMRGYWKNGQRMAYGGDGLNAGTGADLEIPADYMFPGDTDPYQWGTEGVPVDAWSEVGTGNPPGDRLFLQSAGPFTLEPGDYNNITVGMVYARAEGGEPVRE